MIVPLAVGTVTLAAIAQKRREKVAVDSAGLVTDALPPPTANIPPDPPPPVQIPMPALPPPEAIIGNILSDPIGGTAQLISGWAAQANAGFERAHQDDLWVERCRAWLDENYTFDKHATRTGLEIMQECFLTNPRPNSTRAADMATAADIARTESGASGATVRNRYWALRNSYKAQVAASVEAAERARIEAGETGYARTLPVAEAAVESAKTSVKSFFSGLTKTGLAGFRLRRG